VIQISHSAARSIFDEVQRWVDHGIAAHGVPLESLLYPLSALVPGKAWRCPLELLPIDEIGGLVIDGVAIPPDEVKAFSPTNCHFSGEDLDRVNAEFNRRIEALVRQQPRLGVHSKLHAHPFVGGAFLSAGDLRFGVGSPQAVAWRRQRGLATSILHVVYPDRTPGSGRAGRWKLSSEGATEPGPRGSATTWRIRSWASRGDQMVDLGHARIVPERHPGVRAARRLPYWATRRGGRWGDAQKQAMRAAGYRVSRNQLGRGWRRYLLEAGGRTLLFALPPDLPRAPLRAFEVRRAWSNEFSPLACPSWAHAGSLARLSLARLVAHFGPPGRE
jgi:hypothetical protein